MLFLRYFIALGIFAVSVLDASMGFQQDPSYQALLNRPEYKKLGTDFGLSALEGALKDYSSGTYQHKPHIKTWSGIADYIIGNEYFEEQRRYFLVNVMLWDSTNYEGIRHLRDCFEEHKEHALNPYQANVGTKTPQGTVYTQVESDKYANMMKIPNEIRSKIFVKGVSPLVLVKKAEGELSISTKWNLYKVGVAIMYLVSLYLKKDEKDKKTEEKKNSLFSTLDISNALKEIEEGLQKDLEKSFPILKTHRVKSLVDDKTFWLYDRNNWIKGGSAFCMALLAYALLNDKLPNVTHRVHSVIFVV